jgi:hypothetical protein
MRITLVLRRDAPQTIALADSDTLKDTVRSQAVAALRAFFDPFDRGPTQPGWPFGHDVFVSSIYEVLGQVAGVDYVTRSVDPVTHSPLDELTVRPVDQWRLLRASTGELVGVSLQSHELVDVTIKPDDITI